MHPRLLSTALTTIRQRILLQKPFVQTHVAFAYKRGMANDATMASADVAQILDDVAPAPAPGQRVELQGTTYTTIQEGLAYILVPEADTQKADKATAANADAGPVRTVFYNPIQQFNRDLTVLAIKAHGEELVEARKKAHAAKNKKNADKKKRSQEKKVAAAAGEKQDTTEAQDTTADGSAQPEGDSSSKRKREDNSEGDEESNKIAKPDDAKSPHEAVRFNTVAAENAGDAEAEAEARSMADDKEQNPTEEPEVPNEQKEPKEQKAHVPKFTILDALSASGLRALRYASEIPFVTRVTANDLDPAATKAINRNVEHNKLQSKIHVTQGNAIAHMYTKIAASMSLTEKEIMQGKAVKYDVVDLDPYGTAANFLDAAVQSVTDTGGLLCITCTDAGVFASNSYPEKAFALYGGIPIKGWHCHEVGLRLILNAIATSASRYGLYMEPLLSLSIDFYARVFVKIKKSPAAVKFTAGKTMLVYNCDAGCGAWSTQMLLRDREQPNKKGQGSFYKHQFSQGPSAGQHCEHCGFKTHLAGPMYAGRLHNPEFIKRILSKLPDADTGVYGTTERIKGMLTTALEEHLEGPPATFLSRESAWAEIEPYPFFFTPTQLSKTVHCATPGENALRGAISHLGYRSTRSHCKPGSIKTDAPWDVLWHIIREWVRQKSPVKEASITEGTAGYKILKDEEKYKDMPEVVFNETLGKESRMGEKLIRYQVNPREHWGPMNRARGS